MGDNCGHGDGEVAEKFQSREVNITDLSFYIAVIVKGAGENLPEEEVRRKLAEVLQLLHDELGCEDFMAGLLAASDTIQLSIMSKNEGRGL